MTSIAALFRSSRRCLQYKESPSLILRHFSKNSEWRKQQLDKLEQKLRPAQDMPSGSSSDSTSPPSLEVAADEDLQSMWKEMESRVTKRRSRTIAESKGKIGRTNVRRTDEDLWLEQGLYDANDGDESKN